MKQIASYPLKLLQQPVERNWDLRVNLVQCRSTPPVKGPHANPKSAIVALQVERLDISYPNHIRFPGSFNSAACSVVDVL